MQMSLKKAPANEGEQKPKPKPMKPNGPKAGVIPRIVRLLTALLLICIWIIVVTPVWLFTVARTMLGYAVMSVLHIVKGEAGPPTARLDRAANLYPAGFKKAWWLGTGRGADVVLNTGGSGIARFVVDLALTVILVLGVLWALGPAPYDTWGPLVLDRIIATTLDFVSFVTERVQAMTAADPDLPL